MSFEAQELPPEGDGQMASWALACLARTGEGPVPAPPAHDRLAHLAEAFGLGEDGHRLVALFYGLWRGGGQVAPVSAAMARRAVDGAAPHLRGLLVHWQILSEAAVAPGAPLALMLDETIGDWLDGGDPIPPRWHDRIATRPAPAPLPGWPVEDLAARAAAAMERADGPVAVCLTGAPGTGRRSLAAAVAERLGTRPIFADLAGLDAEEAHALVRTVERAARLSLRPPCWIGNEAVQIPEGLPRFALHFVVTRRSPGGPVPAGAVTHGHECGTLPMADRRHAWSTLVPGFATWPEPERERLLHLKPATVGEIARIAATGPAGPKDAMAALRADQTSRLDPVISPRLGRLGWDDLVLPAPLIRGLRRLSDEIAIAPGLWQDPAMERLYPQGRGVFALFSGPPGTGKTMAAQVVANAMGLDLYVVDSGAVVSKYVGETAQNLQSVFAQAQADAAVLFFDEAEGLFGKRTETRDAHARYLNADTNVLLQAVESYAGACILATNRRDNVDTAFIRRLRYVLDFPRPDTALRLQMWQALCAQLSPATAEALAPQCAQLAEILEFTGAQIKNALRTAMIEARRDGRDGLLAEDLLAGVEHELMKEGRALTRAEAARLEVRDV